MHRLQPHSCGDRTQQREHWRMLPAGRTVRAGRPPRGVGPAPPSRRSPRSQSVFHGAPNSHQGLRGYSFDLTPPLPTAATPTLATGTLRMAGGSWVSQGSRWGRGAALLEKGLSGGERRQHLPESLLGPPSPLLHLLPSAPQTTRRVGARTLPPLGPHAHHHRPLKKTFVTDPNGSIFRAEL